MLLARYGVTADEFDAVLAAQDGVCAICGNSPPASGRPLHADHNHKTGVFRGVLCWLCNSRILHRTASSEVLRRAADYLDSPPGVALLGERRGTPKKRKRRAKKFGKPDVRSTTHTQLARKDDA